MLAEAKIFQGVDSKKISERAGAIARVLEHLPSKHEALSSNHSTSKKSVNKFALRLLIVIINNTITNVQQYQC
jgi:hypothetical protein